MPPKGISPFPRQNLQQYYACCCEGFLVDSLVRAIVPNLPLDGLSCSLALARPSHVNSVSNEVVVVARGGGGYGGRGFREVDRRAGREKQVYGYATALIGAISPA